MIMELKEMRKLLGLSQAAFGEKYNIPVRLLSNGRVDVGKLPYTFLSY